MQQSDPNSPNRPPHPAGERPPRRDATPEAGRRGRSTPDRAGDRGADERVVVLAPTGRDGPLVGALLASAGVDAAVCATPGELVERLRGRVGAAVIAEEALTPAVRDAVASVLAQQPPWSDLPVLLLGGRPLASAPHAGGPADAGDGDDGGGDDGGGDDGNAADPRDAGPAPDDPVRGLPANVVLLDRPVARRALLSAVRSALRNRRRQYEARRLLGQLGEGVRQRDRFLAMLGHELRNPLAAIQAACEVLRHGGPSGGPAGDGVRSEHQRLIGRQADLLARLVNDLLDVSRVRSGKVVLKRRPVDLVQVAERCRESVAAAATARRQSLAFRAAGDGAGPVVVTGDPERLEQVITNLLTNAIKYTPEGGRIELAVGREPAGEGARPPRSGRALVRVSDDGVGMTPAVLAGVFDLFSQADESLDRSQGGLGLGLSLVRSLVESHRGSVSAHSDGPGRGSTFEVRLPLAPAGSAVAGEAVAGEAAPPDPSNGDAGATPATPAAPATPARVLLVEDQADTRAVMARLIRGWGHAVETAADGPAALAAALDPPGGGRPDVALIDVGLPGLDGYEVARRLRDAEATAAATAAASPDRPTPMRLVALTGYGQPEDARRSRAAGFDVHLVKPVDFARLRRVLAGGE